MDRDIQPELERLRWRTLVSQNVIGRLLAALEQAVAEIARLRLTDAEREAVEYAICSLGRDDYLSERHAERLVETLEGLTERLK